MDDPLDIIRVFDKWYNHYQKLLMEKNEIAEKNTILEAEVEKLLKRNESLYRDLNGVQEMLGNVQNHEEQIISLKELNRKLKIEISRVEQELKTQTMEFKKKLEMEMKLHEDSLIQTTTKIEREAQGRQAELLEVIKAKEKEITLLTEQIKNTKREADDQKTSLSMEYESKLLEIQRQSTKLMKNNEEAANREKLQKKMQHIKEKYEHEISTLNQKIYDLEGKLYSSTTNIFNSMHRNPSVNTGRQRKI